MLRQEGRKMYERKWMIWSLKNVYKRNNYETVLKEFESLKIDLSQQYTENPKMNS